MESTRAQRHSGRRPERGRAAASVLQLATDPQFSVQSTPRLAAQRLLIDRLLGPLEAQANQEVVQRQPDPARLATMSEDDLEAVLKRMDFADLLSACRGLRSLLGTSDPDHRALVRCCAYTDEITAEILSKIEQLAGRCGYAMGRQWSDHGLFEHPTLSLYPLEGKNPRHKEKASHRVHRPILDIEVVGREPFARCYLGLYAPDPSGKFKDVTADDEGQVKLKDIALMNLGNPFKALLWCEDYLTNTEHYRNQKDKSPPRPVVRSFLVTLDQATSLILQEGEKGAFEQTRPLDQDRGSGQFGNNSDKAIYSEILRPVIGSLVSFFHDQEDFKAASDKGQRRLPLHELQGYLTGVPGDPRSLATKGVAAQHGRQGHTATFAEPYRLTMEAYYQSVQTSGVANGVEVGTGFTGATGGDPAQRRSSNLPSALDEFPKVKSLALGMDFGNENETRRSPTTRRLDGFLQAYRTLPAVALGPLPGPAAESKAKPSAIADDAVKKEPPSKGDLEKATHPTSASKAEVIPNLADFVDMAPQRVLPGSWFNRTPNPGGGDCLFHALKGRTLTPTELLRVRGKVSSVRRHLSDTATGPSYNANVVSNTLNQTPLLANYRSLAMGRHTVPNRVLAALQSVPGVYAGVEELQQWSHRTSRTVIVIEEGGSVMRYVGMTPGQPITQYIPDANNAAASLLLVRQAANHATAVVLFKSADHWERITGVSASFGQATTSTASVKPKATPTEPHLQ